MTISEFIDKTFMDLKTWFPGIELTYSYDADSEYHVIVVAPEEIRRGNENYKKVEMKIWTDFMEMFPEKDLLICGKNERNAMGSSNNDYTSLEQSVELKTRFLNPATANYFYSWMDGDVEQDHMVPKIGFDVIAYKQFKETIQHYEPCWSFGRLLELIPTYIEGGGKMFRFRMDKDDSGCSMWYEDVDTFYTVPELDVTSSNYVDCCCEIIKKVNEFLSDEREKEQDSSNKD